MAPYDNIDRKALIQRYLNAETSVEEERLLAESFEGNPPQDKEEERVASIISFSQNFFESQSSEEAVAGGEAAEEFDRIVSQDNNTQRAGKRNRILVWSLSLSGLAAAVALFFLLHTKPAAPQADNGKDLIQQIQHMQIISQLSLEEADKCEFHPIEGGYVMTAYFPDGNTSSYILVAEEEGNTYSLLSLNQ